MFYKARRGTHDLDKTFSVAMAEYRIFIKCETRTDPYSAMMTGKSWSINKYW